MTIKPPVRMQASGFCLVFFVWIITEMGFSGCQKNLDQKAENAADTQRNVQTTTNNYMVEYPAYKVSSEKLIATNRDTIELFKARLRKANAKLKVSLDSAEQALERANAELQSRIESFKADGQEAWMRFKNQFDRSMDSVRSNLDDLKNKFNRINEKD